LTIANDVRHSYRVEDVDEEERDMGANIRSWIWMACSVLVLSACGGGGSPNSGGPTSTLTITAQPVAETVAAGQTATFTVAATGSGALTYQWYLGAAAIPGATNASFTTPATTIAGSSGVYTVVVTDSSGPMTSNAATLTVTAAANAAIVASQSWASAAVSAANGGVANFVAVQNTSLLPAGSLFLSLPIGATFSGTIPCSSLGTNGSGSVSYSQTLDVSTTYTYDNCIWTSNGETLFFNGTGSLIYTNFVSSSNFTYNITWTLSYAFTGPFNASGTLTNDSETCTISAPGAINCSYSFGGYLILNPPVVMIGGNVATVTNATATITVAGVTESAQAVWSNWVYNQSLGYATSGNVTFTDSNGDSSTVIANGDGTYTVTVTIEGVTTGGVTTTYFVP
jgi:hypothetical protein